jgi:hypothetical protein
MKYIILLNLNSLIGLNYKSKALGKGLVLEILEGNIRVRYNNIIRKKLIVKDRNSLNYNYNLVS